MAFPADASRGFSLLELLVVLAIIGMTLAVVGPNIMAQLDRAGRQFQFEQFRDDLSQLPRVARVRGARLTVDRLPTPGAVASAPAVPLIELPEGWIVRFDPPLVVTANGVCSGANLELRYPGDNGQETLAQFRIAPFTCEVAERAGF